MYLSKFFNERIFQRGWAADQQGARYHSKLPCRSVGQVNGNGYHAITQSSPTPADTVTSSLTIPGAGLGVTIADTEAGITDAEK